MENKTPEEILDEFAVFDGRTIQEFCLMAMNEYGKQQYNQAVLDAAEKIILFYGDKGLTNTGNTIKEQTLKLIKH